MLGTQVHHTTAYYPQSNGLVERFRRHLKSALRARRTGPNWTQELPWVVTRPTSSQSVLSGNSVK